MPLIVGNGDLTGDAPESHVAVRPETLENRSKASPAVACVMLSLSSPNEPVLAN